MVELIGHSIDEVSVVNQAPSAPRRHEQPQNSANHISGSRREPWLEMGKGITVMYY